MFEIYGGRSCLYQWDNDAKLTVDDLSADSDVHFANIGQPLAIIAKTYSDGDKIVVDVPSKVLQTGKDICVYACDTQNTLYHQFVYVIPRAKPSDYIEEGDNMGSAAKWYAVTTIPASLLGSEGDWALNTTNGDAYQKTSGIWTLKCNLKGKDGSAGANATINGVTALTIQQGSNINITQTGSVMTISSTASDGSGNGKSAYQIAVDNGFTGSEVEWLASLKGTKGDTGDRGPAGSTGPAGPKGDKGDPGASGKSAYQVAQEAGYTGTEAQYNELLAKAPDAVTAANNAAETVLAKFPYAIEVLTQSEYQAKVTAATLSNTTLYFIKDVT